MTTQLFPVLVRRLLCSTLLCLGAVVTSAGAGMPAPPAPELTSRLAPAAPPMGSGALGPQRILLLATSVGVVRLSPDGRWLALGTDTGQVLFRAAQGTARLAALTHGSRITALAFSPDGGLLASAGTDAVIRLWDLKGGRTSPRFQWRPGSYSVTALAFSPDGGLLASGGGDNTRQAGPGNSVRLWDTGTGQPAGSLVGHSDGVSALAFLPGGRLLSGSLDHTLRLWNWVARVPLQTIEGHTDGVTALAVSPGGDWVASASLDATVRLWSLRAAGPGQADLQEEVTLRGHGAPVLTVAFSPDGQRLASGGDDRQVRFWSVPDGRALGEGRGHLAAVRSLTDAPGNGWVSVARADRRLLFWAIP